MPHTPKTFEEALSNTSYIISFRLRNDPRIEKKDRPILKGMSTQLRRGLNLTEKQYLLAKNIMIKYQDILKDSDILDLGMALDSPTPEFRVVDKSKSISIETFSEEGEIYKYCPFALGERVLVIKFPYNLDLIKKVEEICRMLGRKVSGFKYFHPKSSNIHFLSCDEYGMYQVVKQITPEGRGFHVSEEIIEAYLKLKNIEDNAHLYTPCLYNKELYSVNDELRSIIQQENVGENSVLRTIDKHRRYGLSLYGNNTVSDISPLMNAIVYREKTDVFIDSTQYSVKELFSVLNDLGRTRILCVLDESNGFDRIQEIHKGSLSTLPKQTSLCRSNSTNVDEKENFNSYVKDNNLNIWVDNDTNMVYTQNKRVPKVIMTSGWSPTVAIKPSSYMNYKLKSYINSTCDLVITYDSMDDIIK